MHLKRYQTISLKRGEEGNARRVGNGSARTFQFRDTLVPLSKNVQNLGGTNEADFPG